MRGFVGSVQGNNLSGEEYAWVNSIDAGCFSGESCEFTNVLVPPSQSEDCDFNDSVLKYISEILMEEDGGKDHWLIDESAALQATEKSFYDVLQEDRHHVVPDIVQNVDCQYENYVDEFSIPEITATSTDEYSFPDGNVPNWNVNLDETQAAIISSKSASPSSYSPSSSSNTSSTAIDGKMISPERMLSFPSMFSDIEMRMQFNEGVEQARKFLPVLKTLLPRKNPQTKDVNLEEGRRNKQPALFLKSTAGSEIYDKVLLADGEGTEYSNKQVLETCNPMSHRGDKSRGKKKPAERKSVDLKALLMLCAQAIAADDAKTATDLLKQIREHSSPTGDGMQRLAHYFAKGLEARMSGIGNNIKVLAGMPPSAGDMLRAYQLYLAACPFRRVSNFFANKTIMNVSEKASRLHIIHFGILYGFQWPSFFQRLSSRPGGPPKLRITGIDVPRPGFKPADRVEETGRLLANYAEMHKIPFEFNAIAQSWETIKLEDLKLEEGELVAVNVLYRMRILFDETVMASSPRSNNPRNNVLNLIKKTNPEVFILGVVNGAYNTPFFVTRFREALFHFSSIFDMLDSNIPRDIHERFLIEEYMFGRQAINVIACEGGERIERPETYKQWHVRNMRAGFTALPLDEEIKNTAIQHVKTSYRKDFLINEDGHWLVQGWRGRTLFALSSWKPAN